MNKKNLYGVVFDNKAQEVYSEVYGSGGGGTKVVTELPEVGDEHTIYELHQEIPADFSWLLTEFDRSERYPLTDYPFIVVENEDQVTQEYLAMPSGVYDAKTVVFVKNTNNVYECYVEVGEEGDTFVKNIMLPEEHNLYGIGEQYIAILKDFDYHVTTGETEEPDLDGTGHFLDGTEFNYDSSILIVPLVLTEAKNPIRLNDRPALTGYHNCKNINDTTELPTAKQAVDGNMCDGYGSVCNPEFSNIQDKLIYFNDTTTDTYSWNEDNQKFGEVVEGDEFIEYTGELQWETELILVVNKIDLNIFKSESEGYPVFNPQQAHTEISYWIYTNGEWVNIDDIGELNTITIPIKSIDIDPGLIPLNKVHFYLDNRELDLITVQSEHPETEDFGYLLVPLLNNVSATYPLHIVFDFDEGIVVGGNCELRNIPVFAQVEDSPHIKITRDTTEYDFDIYVGSLVLFNGNDK